MRYIYNIGCKQNVDVDVRKRKWCPCFIVMFLGPRIGNSNYDISYMTLVAHTVLFPDRCLWHLFPLLLYWCSDGLEFYGPPTTPQE